MGFFGKKKKSEGVSSHAGASNTTNGHSAPPNQHTRQQQQLIKSAIYPNKSVRFAPGEHIYHITDLLFILSVIFAGVDRHFFANHILIFS